MAEILFRKSFLFFLVLTASAGGGEFSKAASPSRSSRGDVAVAQPQGDGTGPTASERNLPLDGEALPDAHAASAMQDAAKRPKAHFGGLNYAVFLLYLVGMVLLGGWFTRRQKNTNDYFKGGQRVPWWAAGLSIYATMLSSITYIAVPAKAFASDWSYIWGSVAILLLAPVIVHFFLPFYRRTKLTSAYEYLEQRFNRVVRFYGSAAFVLLQLGRQSIVLYLPSLAIAEMTDFPIHTCILLTGVFCVIYTVLGGMEAVVWTDVVQTVLLLGAAVASFLLIVNSCEEGFAGFWKAAQAEGKFQMVHWTLDWRTASNAFWAVFIGNIFVTLVPYTSDQAVVQRYLITADERKAASSIWTNALLAIPSVVVFFAIGTALWYYYRVHPEQFDPTLGTDAVFPLFIVNAMPAGLAGLVIAGIFAAAQSTVSGSLNSVATAIVTDFVRPFRKTLSEHGALILARSLTAGFGILAVGGAILLATYDIKSLWDTSNTLIGLVGSGLCGLFLLGIFTRRAHAIGALVGTVASAAVLAWVQTQTDVHFFLYAAIGILTCFLVGYVSSLLIPCPAKDLTNLTLFTRTKDFP